MEQGTPVQKIVVVGTDTSVGKTWVTTELIRLLRIQNLRVAARKIVQSFDPDEDPGLHDRALLAYITGETLSDVCQDKKCFPLALAPPMAAEALGLEVPSLEELLDVTAWPAETNIVFFETAGGLRSPQGSDADALDVAAWLDPDLVLLIAPDVVGAISQVRLCHDALESRLVDGSIIVVLNEQSFQGTQGLNGKWLRDEDGFVVFDGARAVEQLGESLTKSSE